MKSISSTTIKVYLLVNPFFFSAREAYLEWEKKRIEKIVNEKPFVSVNDYFKK